MAVKAANTGMVIIGGGVIKHHICNANLMVRHSPSVQHIPIFRNV
jgi:deoxyhypusine synthase